FTVTTPEELKGNWIATGQWNPHRAFDEKLAQQAAKQPKPKPVDDADSDRPILHRAGSSGGSSQGGSSSGSSGSSSGSSGSSSGSTPAAAENDPNRPTLKKPAEPAPANPTPSSGNSSSRASSSSSQAANAPSPSTAGASPDENDPNRPLLRRGKPAAQASAADQTAWTPPSATSPTTGQAAGAKALQGKASDNVGAIAHRSFPAVSDAGPFEPRSLLYSMNSEERASKAAQMSALALDEIRKFIAQRHTPELPKDAAITDFDLRAYDLEYRNVPTLVFTARLPVPGAKAFRGPEFDYFVTFVAHEDFNGQPVKIFSSVTDSNHLDAFPRMEIIDAVDADANGRGDLLFRQYSDTGISYSLYRVFPYDMEKVFEGGADA
ncbi:MAG TPA: hypothetical protein VMD98_01090, partial [Bryocella sp.]|nr:hypothetical protein [Bryocella sp.]